MTCPFCDEPVPDDYDDERAEYDCPECGASYTLDECEVEEG